MNRNLCTGQHRGIFPLKTQKKKPVVVETTGFLLEVTPGFESVKPGVTQV
jgi:hypothetical protein